VADEEIGTETDGFPEDEQLQKIVREHEHQHGKREEGDIAEEPCVSPIALHVANRINVNECADGGDQ